MKVPKWVGPVVGAIILLGALVVLHNELRHFRYRDIVKSLVAIPQKSILLALLFTLSNYCVLMLYEMEGFCYIRNPLQKYKIGLAAFIAFAFSNNVGFYSISGSAVRFRLYTAWGLSTQEITKLISYSSVLAFWLGLSAICGLIFIMVPLEIPALFNMPVESTRILGILFQSVVTAFLIFNVLRKEPVKLSNWEFDIPPLWLTILLICTAAFDWLLFASVLYVLLPVGSSISFSMFLSYFLLAQLAGLISHVPGGLGVFETVFLLVLPHQISASAVIGSLVVFRFIYYLLPLVLAAILLGVHEFYERRHAIGGVAKKISEWSTSIIPNIFAFSNIWTTATKKELSIDLMRYSKEAPKGVMEYLFTNLLLWGKEQGYARFDLGMAPFSGMETRALAPLWSKLGGFLFTYGENFYNFQGLRQFKEKFDPIWQPRYLACPGGLGLPLVLRDIAALTSGGLKGVVSK